MSKDTSTKVYKPSKLFTHDEINDAIKKFKSRGDSVAKFGQKVALSVGDDLQRTRNMDYVHSLIENMPNGTKVNAMKEWLIKYAQVKEDTDAKNGLAFDRDKDGFDYDGAVANPWWNFAPEKPYVGFDLVSLLDKLVTRAEKAENQEDADKKALDNVPETLLRDLKKLSTRYNKVEANKAA